MIEIDGLMTKITDITTKIDTQASVILGGSRARNEHQPNSDIDVLIVSQKKETIIKKLKNSFSSHHLLDCKVITPNQFTQLRDKKYLFLYAFLSGNKVYHGKPIQVNYSLEKMNQTYRTLLDRLDQIQQRVVDKDTFDLLVINIFNLGKAIKYYRKFTQPDNPLTMKDIFKNHLFRVGRIYEQYSSKTGTIKGNIDIQVVFRNKTSMKKDYTMLLDLLAHFRNLLLLN